MVILFCSFLCSKNAPAPAVLYVSPDISDFISFAMWKFCSEADIVVHPIPTCIFKKVADPKKTLFDNFQASFHKLLTNKYELFIEINFHYTI